MDTKTAPASDAAQARWQQPSMHIAGSLWMLLFLPALFFAGTYAMLIALAVVLALAVAVRARLQRYRMRERAAGGPERSWTALRAAQKRLALVGALALGLGLLLGQPVIGLLAAGGVLIWGQTRFNDYAGPDLLRDVAERARMPLRLRAANTVREGRDARITAYSAGWSERPQIFAVLTWPDGHRCVMRLRWSYLDYLTGRTPLLQLHRAGDAAVSAWLTGLHDSGWHPDFAQPA